MDKELQLLLPLIHNPGTSTVEGAEFHIGTIDGKEIIAMKSGIGKVNAALATSTLIRNYAPHLIINTGVAGGTGCGARIMDVVVGTEIAYHDVWCGPGTEWGTAARCPARFTSAPEITSLPCLHDDAGVKHGLVCSGDIFVSSPSTVAAIKERFPGVMAVDMESAAIAHACHLAATPFLCMRVLSDTPGENNDNAAQYENFWEDAPARTFNIVKRLINEL